MKLIALLVENFRGIRRAELRFSGHDVLVGPNGSGKSTIIDALSLVFGRSRLVRDLTEHDFYGSRPEAASRLRIVATLGGFPDSRPENYGAWFREGRAVPKWWNPVSGRAEPEQTADAYELCAELGFAARFDLEELVVEQIRYFHDDDSLEDPFLEDSVQQIPIRLYDEVGYYVLPARRTWEAAASFASELFRKTVATVGGIPASTVLEERDRLREPPEPLEARGGLRPLADRINNQLAQLLPDAPRFQLRVTGTDSESLLRALIPHYESSGSPALPVARHGMGLLSLQTFILLLELGRERRRRGKPFLFALEEPELHIAPGMQRRLVAQAVAIADQTICTSHAPRVASFYPATSVQVLERRHTELASTPLLAAPLGRDASNSVRKLVNDNRSRVIEALMHHRVLIPEGRSEWEWLRLISSTLETGEQALEVADTTLPGFGTAIGVIPTHDGGVLETYRSLRRLRGGLVPLLDGDGEGDSMVAGLLSIEPPPSLLLQWPAGWAMEEVLGWVLAGEGESLVEELQRRILHEFSNLAELIELFKVGSGGGRLKTDYLAYEEVASVVGSYPGSRKRAADLLEGLTRACMGEHSNCPLLTPDEGPTTERSTLLRFVL